MGLKEHSSAPNKLLCFPLSQMVEDNLFSLTCSLVASFSFLIQGDITATYAGKACSKTLAAWYLLIYHCVFRSLKDCSDKPSRLGSQHPRAADRKAVQSSQDVKPSLSKIFQKPGIKTTSSEKPPFSVSRGG